MAGIAAVINTDDEPLDEALLRRVMGTATCQASPKAVIGIAGSVGMGSGPVARGGDVEALACLNGQTWAVLDGRLDDRAGLVSALEGRGHDGAADMSDAGLVRHAYETWGDDCVSRLIGDFAFCLWDARNRRLFCARDHFGVKPLYYARVGNVLVVSSVLRWVRRHPAVSRELRDEAIGDFLLSGVCAEASQTSFADVSRVPPAHRLSYSRTTDSLHVDRFWSLETRELVRYGDPREYVERFSDLLRAAVGDRLRSGPVGVLMSGGLDSSSVATVAADILGPSARHRLHAFTFVYDTWSKDEEKQYASLVSTSLGIKASQMAVDRYEPFDRWDTDSLPPEPSLEGLTAVMTDVLDLASRHGGVVLTGDGGDPMLLPSSVIDQVGTMPLASLAADVWRAFRLRRPPPFGIRSGVARRFSRSETIPDWLGGELLSVFDAKTRWRELHARRSVSHGARNRAVSDVLDPWWTSTFEGLDPGATQRPVELRYPFFDVRLASFTLRLPSFPWCLGKHVLRAAMNGKLPDSIRTRPKTPLAASPVSAAGQWSSSRALDLFDSTPEVARFVDARRFGASVRGNSLLASETPGAWAAISLAMWLRGEALGAAKAETI